MALVANNISGSASNQSRIGITGSVVFANLPGSSFPSAPNGVTFFVSGSSTSIGADSPSILFKGDTFNSGAFGVSDYIQMKPVGSLRIPTNQSASYIYTSGSTNDIYFTQYQPGTNYTNTTRLRWLEGSLSTGLLAGGLLSTENGTTTYSITSGSGLIISYNASLSNEPYPTIKYVNWGNIVSSSLPSIGTKQISYIAIDSTGTPVVSSTPFIDGDFENKIILGRILHQVGSVTNGAATAPTVAFGQTEFRGDFVRAFGPIKISGHTFYANGTAPTLGLKKDAGDSYAEGRNYSSNPNSPNYVKSTTDTAQNTSKIFYEYVNALGDDVIDSGVGGAGYAVIDPTYYNNNGTKTLVGSGNKYTIQRVFWFPNSVNRAFYVYYGNTIYGTIVEAQAGIATEVFTEGSNSKDQAIFLGYIIVKGTATDLLDSTQAKLIQAGSFRAVASSGAGPVGTPGGSDTQVQFNDAGSFGGDSGLTYNKTTDSLTVTGNITGSNISVTGGSITTTQSTFTLLNGNATTVNIAGGASTALNIGNAAGTNTVSGQTKFSQGLSGSLTKLTDGTSYLIAGTNVSITTGSSGAVTIANTMPVYFSSTTAGSIFTTGSVAFVDGESATVDAPSDKGTDVFFYVSGSTATNATSGVTLFGGNTVTSGSITGKNGAIITGDVFEMTGTLTVTSNAAINGGSLTTSATTFNLVNTAATTINFAGAGTNINIGAATGNAYIKNAALNVSGSVTTSNYYAGTADSLTGAGAASATTHVTLLTSNGAGNAITLANGTLVGQLKFIIANSGHGGGNTSVITPTNLLGYTTITFDAVGDTVSLLWTGSKWAVVGSNSATLA